MKRGILAATLLVTAAGVASANLLTAPGRGGMPADPSAPPAGTAARASMPAPAVQKPTVEARQAPVPLQLKPRPAVSLPAAAQKEGDGKAVQPATDAPGNDAFNETLARAAIEADGYRSVKVLRRGANGIWHASGLRGKTTVMLTVDGNGTVTAD